MSISNPVHILVVDDEPEIRSMISRYLKFKGFLTDEAENGFEALEKMQSRIYQVVISDISMPVMDGIVFLKKAKRDNPMTHFIMITGYVTQDNVLSCIRYGADNCIFKPIQDMQELEDSVNMALHQITNWNKKLKMLLALKD